MRFRMADLNDLPYMTDLYVKFMEESQNVYPQPGPERQIRAEWSALQCVQMCTNQQGYFAIVGVVQSEKVDGRVVGGIPKCFITVYLTPRTIGNPKKVGFCEMLIVDPRFRGRGAAKKLVLLACRYSKLQGAEVFEASWKKGSAVGESWKALGMIPYQETGAWILEDGTPRSDLIFEADGDKLNPKE